MLHLVRPTAEMKEAALEYKKEHFEDGVYIEYKDEQ